MVNVTYTSGEFAALFNLNKKTLEYYRKIGLFMPHFLDNNGYARYSHHQIDLLYIILSLKKLNLSLKEIQKYTRNKSPQRLIELLDDKIIEAQKQSFEINKVKNYLQETVDYTRRGLSYNNRLNFSYEEEQQLLTAESKLVMCKNDQVKFEEATFSPETSCIGTIVPLDGSPKQMFIKLYKNGEVGDTVKPAGMYASNIHIGPHELIHNTYNKMKKEIQDKGYKLGDVAYEEYLIDDLATDDQNLYVTMVTIEIVK